MITSLPAFRYHGVVLHYEGLRYQPKPDIIFPCVVHTDSLEQPLGGYYCYYAPHDPPGGVCLAYADAPEGPWTEYPQNPVIARDWAPHYDVSHVSSPHALWLPEEETLAVFFHGENDTTRYALSSDGVHFAYGDVAITTAMFSGLSEASYARVFRHAVPGTDIRYVMTLMGNDRGTRKVFLATSPDARCWTARQQPVLVPPPGTDQMGPGWLFSWEGQHYLIAFANRTDSPDTYDPITDVYLYAVDPALTQVEYLGMLMDHAVAGPDNYRLSDPCLLIEQDRLYLFLNAGRRCNQTIALAIAEVTR